MSGQAYQGGEYNWLQYLQYTQPAPTAIPEPYTPRVYTPLPATRVGTHSGGACGCGTNHAAPAAAVEPVATVTPALPPPSFLGGRTATAMALQTPAGFQAPALTPEFTLDFLKQINWQADWWKFAAGALAYRLLAR